MSIRGYCVRSFMGSVQFNCEALAPWQSGLCGSSKMVPCRKFCGCLTGRSHHGCLYISPSWAWWNLYEKSHCCERRILACGGVVWTVARMKRSNGGRVIGALERSKSQMRDAIRRPRFGSSFAALVLFDWPPCQAGPNFKRHITLRMLSPLRYV